MWIDIVTQAFRTFRYVDIRFQHREPPSSGLNCVSYWARPTVHLRGGAAHEAATCEATFHRRDSRTTPVRSLADAATLRRCRAMA